MPSRPAAAAARSDPTRRPLTLWLFLLAATVAGTLATVLALTWTGPEVASVDGDRESDSRTTAQAPADRGGARSRGRHVGGADAGESRHKVVRDQIAADSAGDDDEALVLRLPGQLPPLPDPQLEAAARADRALQRDVERARAEAAAIGDRMAADLEQFVAELQPLPRAEQRQHARNVHARFDWQSADRLAVLRARLPEAERDALQVVTYRRIEPLIWQLDAMAAED